jgi:outer membrane protein TolC
LTLQNHVNAAYKSRRKISIAVAGLSFVLFSATAQAQVTLAAVVELAQRNSAPVRLAQADVQKAAALLSQSRSAFIPSVTFGSGLPAFSEIGFTGSLPTIWDSTVQSMVFSLPQIQAIRAAHTGLLAAQFMLKDAREQVALDASTTYLELDTVSGEIEAAKQQQQNAARLVEIEQQRAEAGVDPLSELLQAQLTAAQLKLKLLHLETRATMLAKQLSVLTSLPASSIVPDHASIPPIPTVSVRDASPSTAAIESARSLAHSKELLAKGDKQHSWLLPQLSFGLAYNRNTTLLNNINNYYAKPLPANNLSSGFSIQVPLFDATLRGKAKESAAEALRAQVEVEQAQRQNEIQIAQLDGTLRELDVQAEIANLKQQVSNEQLKSVLAQLELGNGASSSAGTPQLSPKAEEQAHIDERDKFIDSLDAALDLGKTRLNLLRALGHMQDWLDELRAK